MKILENISLKSFNTFRINVSAKYFAAFTSAEELIELISNFQKLKTANSKIFILGGGSNILFMDNFDGLVLKNEIRGIEVIKEDADHVYVKAGAGENWHQFVQYCLEHNIGGIENLSLIPGNVGASPMQNIGAYGVEIKDVFESLDAFDVDGQRVVSFSVNDCEFGYRESIFKGRYKDRFVILHVIY